MNYAGAVGRDLARVVSGDTTAVSRIMHALHRHGWVKRVRARPFNRRHLRFAMVEATRHVSVDELRGALRDAPRVAFVRAGGVVALDSVIELMRDLGRPRSDMWEVTVCEDALAADEREVYLAYQVQNEAIVVPETVDCDRALTGNGPDGAAPVATTDAAPGFRTAILPGVERSSGRAA